MVTSGRAEDNGFQAHRGVGGKWSTPGWVPGNGWLVLKAVTFDVPPRID